MKRFLDSSTLATGGLHPSAIHARFTQQRPWASQLGLPRSGVLTIGADADLCIADRDPFAAPAEEIYITCTRLTMLAGQIIPRE